MRKMLAVLALVLSTAYANAQVVFKGPTEGKPGRMNIVTLDKVDGDDLKLLALYNGKPADMGDWMLMKNIDNQFVIFILTDKEGVFTFIGAINKTGKTYQTNHVITIGKPNPNPNPNPNPSPNPDPAPANDYPTKLKAAYNVSPDPTKLSKLISILDEVSSRTYKNYDEMETVLQATAKKFLSDTDLRGVRDTISDQLIKVCGDDSRRRDIDKVKAVYADTVKVLKAL